MKVPFFPNTEEGKHCYQAALAMIFKYFRPDKDYTYAELDEISDKVPGKWTWPTAAMLWMLDHGYELRLIEDFDYQEFADRGADYIMEKAGPEVGKAQIANSDIERELKYARKFAKLNLVERRLPTFNDIRSLVADGYLLLCNINAAALYNQPGYSGHFVVVFDCSEEYIHFHDPGLPPGPDRHFPLSQFEKAWAYPTEEEKNLLAIRLKNR